MTYTETALDYARKVVEGKIDACAHVRKACQRQLDDYAKKDDKDYPFVWIEEEADKVCRFVENLPHIKGQWTTPNLTLEPWQAFILTTVFGWYSRETLFRRFRTAYIEVPRKNGKSFLSAAVALYMFLIDGEPGAEIYSAATMRDQARIVFDLARRMILRGPFGRFLRSEHGIHQTTFNMNVEKTNSKFEPLSADAHTLDGLNIHCATIDELHAHRDRKVFDVIETAIGSRRQPLIWIITTAGSNRAGICYEVRGYTIKVLDDVAQDDTFFGIIYTLDEDDDWRTEDAWKKANPNYGVSVFPNEIARLCWKAQHMASAQPNFLIKYLCVWVNADRQWMDILQWKKRANVELDETDFAGERCWQGIDLASKTDIASRVKLFRRKIEEQDHYFLFADHYLPELTIEKSTNSQYEGWRRDGWLTATPGDVIDFGYIEDDLKADRDWFEIVEIGYDPFQATQFSTRMIAEGFPMVQISATTKNFSEPMKELEALVLSERLHHNGDPVLEWMVSNVVAHLDNKDNIYPRKERPENKIDGVIALIMALARAMFAEKRTVSVYANPETARM